MTPIEMLILVLAITLAGGGWHYLLRQQRREALMKLARQLKMNYVPVDRFKLAQRMRDHCHISESEPVRVLDVIYGLGENCYRYIFTVCLPVDQTGGHHPLQYVAGVIEPKEAGGTPCASRVLTARLTEDFTGQYRAMVELIGRGAPADAATDTAPAVLNEPQSEIC